MRIKQVKNTIKPAQFNKIQLFFFNKRHSDCCKLVCNILKKNDSWTFLPVLYERADFKSTGCAILEVLAPSCSFNSVLR
jgi:hypothetical protein